MVSHRTCSLHTKDSFLVFLLTFVSRNRSKLRLLLQKHFWPKHLTFWWVCNWALSSQWIYPLCSIERISWSSSSSHCLFQIPYEGFEKTLCWQSPIETQCLSIIHTPSTWHSLSKNNISHCDKVSPAPSSEASTSITKKYISNGKNVFTSALNKACLFLWHFSCNCLTRCCFGPSQVVPLT